MLPINRSQHPIPGPGGHAYFNSLLRFNHSSFAMSLKYIAKLFAFAVFAGLDGLLDGRVASGWSRKAAFGASR